MQPELVCGVPLQPLLHASPDAAGCKCGLGLGQQSELATAPSSTHLLPAPAPALPHPGAGCRPYRQTLAAASCCRPCIARGRTGAGPAYRPGPDPALVLLEGDHLPGMMPPEQEGVGWTPGGGAPLLTSAC